MTTKFKLGDKVSYKVVGHPESTGIIIDIWDEGFKEPIYVVETTPSQTGWLTAASLRKIKHD